MNSEINWISFKIKKPPEKEPVLIYYPHPMRTNALGKCDYIIGAWSKYNISQGEEQVFWSPAISEKYLLYWAYLIIPSGERFIENRWELLDL